MIHLLGNIAVFVAAGAATLFCVLYHLSAPWRRSSEGWHLMSFTALHALIFGWIGFRVATVSTPSALPGVQDVARSGIYLLAAGCLVWRLALLWHHQIGPGLRRRTPK